MITIGELNLKLSPKLYKNIAKILVPEKEWIRYYKNKKLDIVVAVATDGSELYHHDYGYKTYKFQPLYWNSSTGYTFLEEIVNIKSKMRKIKIIISAKENETERNNKTPKRR